MRAIVMVLLVTSVCWAHAGDDRAQITVSASGSVSLLATDLEVAIALQEKGEDMAAAVANLKVQRGKIAAKLAELGANAASVKEDTPVAVDAAQQQNMRQMMMARSGRLSRTKPGAEAKPEVQVRQTLRVKFPLKGKDATALVVEAEGIKARLNPELKKILKAGGAEEEAKADEDDEMAAMQQGRGNTGPAFYMFGAQNSDDVQSRALATALDKAKSTALRAAKAMGKTGAELVGVALHTGGNMQGYQNGWDEYNEYGNPYNRMMSMMNQGDGLTSNTPDISANTTVTATFRPQ